jgi:hypothetical protein
VRTKRRSHVGRVDLDLDLNLTLGLLALSVGLAVLFGWLGARPWDIRKGPRLAPWRFLMLLAATWAMLMLAHVATLLRGGPTPPLP